MPVNSKKIMIIGNGGSGKSTLASKLHKKLGLPLYRLDQYYWNPGWERVDAQEFERIHRELCDKDAWIIEGVGQRVWQYRFEKADIIIFLDTPTYVCLWRVIKRSLCNWGRVIPGDPEGRKQRIFSVKFLDFLQWVWNFNMKYKPRIEHILENLDQSKKIYILKSQEDINALLSVKEG